MAKILIQITTLISSGSIGHIVQNISELAAQSGWQTYTAYGRGKGIGSNSFKIGGKWDMFIHILKTRFTDLHGFGSKNATKRLIAKLENIKPDIIHLHNIHGYYINIELLLRYLSTTKIPVVLTMHDCWIMTGHCVHFQDIKCNKWKTSCNECPSITSYPKSIVSRARRNFETKKELFSLIDNLTIVPVCNWLADLVKESHLSPNTRQIIPNGIDLETFRPKEKDINLMRHLNLNEHFVILAISRIWDRSKGLYDIIELQQLLDSSTKLVVVGLTKSQMKKMPKNIISIERTQSLSELASLYSMADVVINPTYQDTLPTVNMEAIACGTPVVTYNTGGCCDIIDSQTGICVNVGNVQELLMGVNEIKTKGKSFYSPHCRERAVKYYDKNIRFKEYITLYENLTK